MQHLGDITKINGAEIEPVWAIIGGSPCQDLSVAGKRAGLAGARSGLFMEQIRVIKEMRQHERDTGRTNDMVRPRYMVWENVPGAFSSNKGEDFRAVLEETARIADGNADVPQPPNGKWSNAGCIMGNGWSIAWRVHDAQFWGVPQRRRRISLVADFGGQSAPEILFERKGVSGDIAESGTAGQGAAGNFKGGTGEAICYPINTQIITRHNSLGKGTGFGLGEDGDPAYTLQAGHEHGVICLNGSGISRPLTARNDGSPCIDRGPEIVCFAQNQRDEIRDLHDVAESLAAEPGMKQQTFCIQGNCIDRADTAGCNGKGWTEGVSYTLNTIDRPAVFDAREPTTFPGDGITSKQNASKGTPGVCHTLNQDNRNYVVAGFCQGASPAAQTIGYQEEVSPTIKGAPSGTAQVPAVFDARDNGDGATSPTLTGDHQNRVTDYTAVTVSMQSFGEYKESNQSETLRASHDVTTSTLIAAVDCRNGTENPDVNGTLQAKEQGQNLNSNNVVRSNMTVRRLTPLECERLQGYPDGWTDIPGASDSARYKALGNSIALPFWRWMLNRMSTYLPAGATLGSLFDGIGGFPLIWEEIHGKGTARWASEIEKFPIAVTEYHFGRAYE